MTLYTTAREREAAARFFDDRHEQSERVLSLMSAFLNDCPTAITPDMLSELQDCGMDAQAAYALLLASVCGLDVEENAADRALYHDYFEPMVHRLEASVYRADPYAQAVQLDVRTSGAWTLRMQRYAPCEAFVCGDMEALPDGRVLPRVGFFEEPFDYLAVLERGREWMTITPNEIETMRPAVDAARGRVLTYGLGLGYFAFMAARKPSVSEVVVVERDAAVIELFQRELLPHLGIGEKLRIVRADAFEFAPTLPHQPPFDVVFCDLWHDASDGVPLYLRMKQCERFSPQSQHLYWIEPTLKLYVNAE